MELKYGDSTTYNHELDERTVEWLCVKVNRAKHQLQFLFNLVDGDLDKLFEIECNIKNHFFFYCPDCLEERDKILALPQETKLIDKRTLVAMQEFAHSYKKPTVAEVQIFGFGAENVLKNYG